MPRSLAAALILAQVIATALLGGAATAQDVEVRWVTVLTGDAGTFEGNLEAIRSDGRGRRLLVEGGVASADVTRRGTVVAVRREDEVSELLRIGIRGGTREMVPAGPEGTFLISVVVSPDGVPAVGRAIPVESEVPEHLADSIKPLRRTTFPVLAPPERPEGTTGTVTEATRRFYRLLFTNDPEGRLAHAEQVNRFVSGSTDPPATPEDATTVEVRGTQGSFSCGASSCFLDWEEEVAHYSVGEFGRPEDAVEFAESLQNLDELIGYGWQFGANDQEAQLVALDEPGERVIQAVEGFCECGYRPVDWGPDGILVVFSAEGSTTLEEYPTGGGEPRTVQDESEGTVLDAAYGPDGIVTLLGGEGGPPGRIVGPDGETMVDAARALDLAGTTLAYVDENGLAIAEDLETGDQVELGTGAFDVSIASAPIAPRPQPSPTVIEPVGDDDGPGLPWFPLAAGAVAVLLGAVLVRMAVRRR